MEKEVDGGNPRETPRVSDGLGTLLERDSKHRGPWGQDGERQKESPLFITRS